MASIQLAQVAAFDATVDFEFRFSYQGNQSVKNLLTVYDNATNAVVYSAEQNTYKLAHLLPAGSLSNGGAYNAEATAFDINGVGATSAKIVFKCLDAPLFWFDGLSDGAVIRNSHLTAALAYSQAQGDPVNEYRVSLYDSGMAQLWDSGIRHGPVAPVELGGLVEGSVYHIRAVGRSVSGMALDTSAVQFSVEYDRFQLNQVLLLENMPRQGMVKVSSRIVVITGKSMPDPPTYIDDEFVDLREPGSKVWFDDGFSLDGDFVVEFIGFGFSQNQPQLYMCDGEGNAMECIWRKGRFANPDKSQSVHTFAEVRVSPGPIYCVFSNHINENIGDLDMVHVWVRRMGGLYECRIAKL